MKPTARTTVTTWIILAMAGGGSFMLPDSLPTVTPPPTPTFAAPPPGWKPALPAADVLVPMDPIENDRAADSTDAVVPLAAVNGAG